VAGAAALASLLALAACGGSGPSSLASPRTTTEATTASTAPPGSGAETTEAATTTTSSTEPMAAGTTSTAASRPDVQISIVVPGTQPYTDTRIDVNAGDAIAIDASGTIFAGQEPQYETGPDGLDRPDLNQFNVVTNTQSLGAGHGALLAKVGEGRPFVVGHHDEFTAGASGRLFLGINDTGLDNNSGHYSVQVSVTKR
jgi:hypothetical protein